MPEWKRKEGESERGHVDRVFDMKMMADVMRRDRIKPEDPDFKEKLSQYMAGEIDPSVARHIEFDIPDSAALNLYGQYNHLDKDINRGSGKISFTLAPDIVAAIHTRNTPSTWSHEFRHRNFPNLSESNNRTIDKLAAQTDYDLDEALRLQSADRNFRRRKRGLEPLPPSAEIAGLRLLPMEPDFNYRLRNTLEALGTTGKEAYESSKAKELYDDAVALDKWNAGLDERNEKKKKKGSLKRGLTP